MSVPEALVSKVIEEDGNLIMLVPQELMKRVEFKKDQILIWVFNEDGSITLTPTEIKI